MAKLAAAALAVAVLAPAPGRPDTDAILLESGEKDVLGVAFSPDGAMVAAVSVTRPARQDDPSTSRLAVWAVAEGRLLRQSGPTPFQFLSLAFSPDGRTIATGRPGGEVTLWEVSALRELGTLRGGTGSVTGVAFSPDGKLLAAAASRDGAILWEVASRRRIAALAEADGGVSCVAFSPAGDRMATGGADGAVRLWDLAGQPLARLPGLEREVGSVAFSPDGRQLAAASRARTGTPPAAIVWDVASEAITARILDSAGGGPAAVATFSPSGALAVGGATGVRVVDPATGATVKAWVGQTAAVAAAAFSRDGTVLVTGDAEGTVRLWDMARREAPGAAGVTATTTVATPPPSPSPSPAP